MTVETGTRTDLRERIQALRERLVALETAAGTAAAPVAAGDADAVRHGTMVLRGLMKTLLVGFAAGDSAGHILDANEAFAYLLGYDRRELLAANLTWQAITPAEYGDLDRDALAAIERFGTSGPYVKEYFRRDGSRVRVTLVGTQSTLGLDEHVVFVLDDSARHRARLSTARTDRMYKQVLDAIPDLVLLRDLDARIAWANRAYLDFYGVDRTTLAGCFSPRGETDPLLASELRDHAVVLETRMAIDLPRQTLDRTDGERRVFHTVRSPVPDPDAGVVCTVSVSRDVTDRTCAEEALRRSEANLRTAQRLGRIGSFEMGIPDAGDIYWSSEVFEILGLPVSTPPIAPAAFIERFVRPDHAHLVVSAMEGLARDGLAFDIHYPLVTAGGDERWVRGLGVPIREASGAVAGVMGTLIDVTEQRQAEAEYALAEGQLRRTQELEAVATLARGAAHDFNNLLASLSGFTELALTQAGSEPALRADLEEVSRAASRAADLVARLLDFSRQQESPDLPSGIRLDHVARDAVALLRTTLPPGTEIETFFDPDVPEVPGDASQMLQLVLGLGTSVIEAMAVRGGALEIRVEAFECDDAFARAHPELAPGHYARLSLSGTGREVDLRPPGSGLESSATPAARSATERLRVSVVETIVREHGGAIVLESAPGAGAVAHVYLPAEPIATEARARDPRDAPRGAGQRVLLIDDERALAELGQRRLEDLGYVPTIFTDARRALETFRQRPGDFDLVVTDQVMPHLTGTALAREIHHVRPKLPVVLVSGHGDALRSETLAVAGIRSVLSKPVSVDTFAHALKDALAEPKT